MKASQALKLTKERMLPSNKFYCSRYICDNVDQVTYNNEATKKRIIKHIDKLLGGAFSLHEWLIINGHVPGHLENGFARFQGGTHDYGKMQRTRMLWLDDMIKHFKAKGD